MRDSVHAGRTSWAVSPAVAAILYSIAVLLIWIGAAVWWPWHPAAKHQAAVGAVLVLFASAGVAGFASSEPSERGSERRGHTLAVAFFAGGLVLLDCIVAPGYWHLLKTSFGLENAELNVRLASAFLVLLIGFAAIASEFGLLRQMVRGLPNNWRAPCKVAGSRTSWGSSSERSASLDTFAT